MRSKHLKKWERKKRNGMKKCEFRKLLLRTLSNYLHKNVFWTWRNSSPDRCWDASDQSHRKSENLTFQSKLFLKLFKKLTLLSLVYLQINSEEFSRQDSPICTEKIQTGGPPRKTYLVRSRKLSFDFFYTVFSRDSNEIVRPRISLTTCIKFFAKTDVIDGFYSTALQRKSVVKK